MFFRNAERHEAKLLSVDRPTKSSDVDGGPERNAPTHNYTHTPTQHNTKHKTFSKRCQLHGEDVPNIIASFRSTSVPRERGNAEGCEAPSNDGEQRRQASAQKSLQRIGAGEVHFLSFDALRSVLHGFHDLRRFFRLHALGQTVVQRTPWHLQAGGS
eukprot:scaffold269_cov229-Pinguiococcus_pyrenoidosus.AAC.12